MLEARKHTRPEAPLAGASSPRRHAVRRAALAAALVAAAAAAREVPAQAPDAPPPRLSETGLYRDIATQEVAADVVPYAPQYPLWTDGAAKRRWVRLPAGSSIDASDPWAWEFPVGTRFWKEFSFGRRVETRLIEKQANGRWSFATYLWDEDGRDATLAPERGVRGAAEIRPGIRHDVPGRGDCRVCHEGRPGVVLGFDALQLSPDRDPGAPHAEPVPPGGVDLRTAVERGLLRGLPRELLDRPPRIAARSPSERAALGYLATNCGSCHSLRGTLASVGLSLEHDPAARSPGEEPALRTAIGRAGQFVPSGAPGPMARIAPGDPVRSLVVARMASRDPAAQMPPLGTHVVDDAAVALVARWIREDLRPVGGDHPGNSQLAVERTKP